MGGQISFNDNDDVVIKGGTDDTPIGNTADRLKVTATITSNPAGYSSKLRYLDMNAASGGVARETSITNAAWVDLFSYSGSGVLIGFGINLETGSDWLVRLVVDGEEIFQDATTGLVINDLIGDSLYDWDSSGKNTTELAENIGLYMGSHDRLVWNSPLAAPTKYTSSVVVKVRRAAGVASKKFKAGLIVLTKDT